MIQAAAKSPDVVHEMEASMRDENHSVGGTGTNDLGEGQIYRWGFTHVISIGPTLVRKQRYDAITELVEKESTNSASNVGDQIQTSKMAGDPPLEVRTIDSLEVRETNGTAILGKFQQPNQIPTPPSGLASDGNPISPSNANSSQQQAIKRDGIGNEVSKRSRTERGTE